MRSFGQGCSTCQKEARLAQKAKCDSSTPDYNLLFAHESYPIFSKAPDPIVTVRGALQQW